MTTSYIGQAQNRVDGRAKVTGAAQFAGELRLAQVAAGLGGTVQCAEKSPRPA